MAAVSRVLVVVLLPLSGCGPQRNGSTDGATEATHASSDATEESEAPPDLPSDEPQPYGMCNEACLEPAEADDIYCARCSGCGANFGSYAVCAWNCELPEDCPDPPGGGGDVTCSLGSCFFDCATGACPDGMQCIIAFGNEADVCMFER